MNRGKQLLFNYRAASENIKVAFFFCVHSIQEGTVFIITSVH